MLSQDYAIHNYGLAPVSIRRCARTHHHTLHTSKTFFFLSHALPAHSTIYKRERWTHSKCFGEISQHIFYAELMTSVLKSCRSSNVPRRVETELLNVSSTAIKLQCRPHRNDADRVHTLTIPSIHTAHLAYIKAILIARREHPQ